MKILNSAQMKEADRYTIETLGLPGIVLMENAAVQVVEVLSETFEELPDLSVCVVCGRGNNGGDGLAISRHLHLLGVETRAYVLSEPERLQGDARTNYDLACRFGVSVATLPDLDALEDAAEEILSSDLIVDAILGTGINSAAEGLPARAIELLEMARAPIVAVDVPSGLSSDTGDVPGPAVHADRTVTFAYPKICHFLSPAEEYVGDLVVTDIGIPDDALPAEEEMMELINERSVVELLPPRAWDSHKGDFGHVLVCASSMGKTGAAVMAAKGALVSGAGLVTVGAPTSCQPIIAASTMETMTEALAEESGAFSSGAVSQVLDLLADKDVLVLGPGIGTQESTREFVRGLVTETPVPIVLDADGINCFAGDTEPLRENDQEIILTPHPGEMGRLLGLSAGDVLHDRVEIARDFARDHKVYLVLKGYRTLVCLPDGHLFVNLTGNPGMASGGTGDVLAGVIGGLIAQGLPTSDALCLAVYIHGLAGDLAAEEMGEISLTAGALLDYLPDAFGEIFDDGDIDLQ